MKEPAETQPQLTRGAELFFNQSMRQLKWLYTEGYRGPSLKVSTAPEIYFDPQAGGTILGGSDAWVKSKHKNGRIHEPGTVAALYALRNMPRRVGVVFDIGALYGYFTLLSAAFFPESLIVPFEMNPDSCDAMQKNLRVNRHLHTTRILCANVALSDSTSLGTRAAISGMKIVKGEGDATTDFVRLDDYCRITGLCPDIIKMDVEGYQEKILPGAMDCLRRYRPYILMEFDNKAAVNHFGMSNKDIVKPVFDLGYRMLWCAHQRATKASFVELGHEQMGPEHEQNSLAVFIPGELLR